jgi:hypothetical protein
MEQSWHVESRKRPSFASILIALDDAIIKAVISDKDAAEYVTCQTLNLTFYLNVFLILLKRFS